MPCVKFDTSVHVPKDAIIGGDWNSRWIPPKAGQFTEIGKEDECWARGLGLGTVAEVQLEPIQIQFQAILNERMYRELTKNTETGIFGKCQSQSAATAENH
jgi:hypothetical protein